MGKKIDRNSIKARDIRAGDVVHAEREFQVVEVGESFIRFLGGAIRAKDWKFTLLERAPLFTLPTKRGSVVRIFPWVVDGVDGEFVTGGADWMLVQAGSWGGPSETYWISGAGVRKTVQGFQEFIESRVAMGRKVEVLG